MGDPVYTTGGLTVLCIVQTSSNSVPSLVERAVALGFPHPGGARDATPTIGRFGVAVVTTRLGGRARVNRSTVLFSARLRILLTTDYSR